MSITAQVQRLIQLGAPELAGISGAEFTAYADGLPDKPGALLVIHTSLIPAAKLATLLWLNGRPGFVVIDLTDLGEFEPINTVTIPDRPLYLLHDVERGDEMSNWSPKEALPAIAERGRTPLTINEGISWLLQDPAKLEPNRCFMTIGSRKMNGSTLDTRTPAIWISGGTGRDGKHHRGAPKVGWCWAGNRHTWLGFASGGSRIPT
ncbi:MAG: hypothetical protein H0X18_01800 [Geodermatophilaceae bacterium]|nr:hypothetical protein [Geodermatophilaceae bacterium]